MIELHELEFGCHLDAEYYREGAQNLIRRLVPKDLLNAPTDQLPYAKRMFHDLLPLFTYSNLEHAPSNLSLLLLCKYRQNASQFFYEMTRHWLLPHKKMNIELFFTADIRLPDLSTDLLSVAEIVVQIKSVHELEEIKRSLNQFETEIRLGVTSHYQARKILEFKGLSNDGKTAMIQEKICSLIQNRSQDFDREIFSSMQKFLVTCSEEFKKERDYHHISRIISNLHSLRKLLKQGSSGQIHLKFLKTRLIKGRPVLGILAGLSLLKNQERFEENHFIEALKKLPYARIVDNSSFIDRCHQGQNSYLEIEKADGSEFSHEEIQILRMKLPNLIRAHIEQMTHPVFMPRNEEEVLRNIMILSQQLRFVSDIPHVIITFDEQKAGKLFFTLIFLRVLGPKDLPINHYTFPLPVTFDRIRKLGTLGRKHYKESSVFRTQLSISPFLRSDQSVDLYQARQHLLSELSQIFGPIRDYNGGMISKQNEAYLSLKSSLGLIAEQHTLLLERFFFSLAPVELRSVMECDTLKQLFQLFLQAQQRGQLIKQEKTRTFCILLKTNLQKIRNILEPLQIPPHQLISFHIDDFSGFVFTNSCPKAHKLFIQTLKNC